MENQKEEVNDFVQFKEIPPPGIKGIFWRIKDFFEHLYAVFTAYR